MGIGFSSHKLLKIDKSTTRMMHKIKKHHSLRKKNQLVNEKLRQKYNKISFKRRKTFDSVNDIKSSTALSTSFSQNLNNLTELDKETEENVAKEITDLFISDLNVSITNPDTVNKNSSFVKINDSSQLKRVNFDPHTILLDAAIEGELDLVMKCAQQVKNVSEPNYDGVTALHNSICAGHFNIVKFLVEFGCDINYADNDGWTPLHSAASCNNLEIIKFLVENGASLLATTLNENERPIKMCNEDDEANFQVCYDYLYMMENIMGNVKFNEAIVYTLYSYENKMDDELSFECDEELVVLDKNENETNDENEEKCWWWTCRSLASEKEGLVPKNYLGLYPRFKCESKKL